MANRCSSRGPLHLRTAHLLIVSSLLLALLLLLSHSTLPARCSSSTAPSDGKKSAPEVATSDKTDVESCRLDNERNEQELCAAKLRRKQNATQKKKEPEASAVYGRTPAEAEVYLASESDDKAQSWRYQYFEEPAKGFKVKVMDESFDERLANVIHTVIAARPSNVDFFTYNSGDPLEDAANMDSAAGPQVDETQCGRHLDEMLGLLDEINQKLAHKRANSSARLQFDEKHLRLARVLDSYGRYEAGHLSGKQHSTGQWDQCTSTSLLLSSGIGGDGDSGGEQQLVPGGFCWARMDLNKHMNDGLKRRPKDSFEAADHPLMIGICLPRTCHSKTFAANRERIQRLVDSQFRLPNSLYIDETLRVDSIYCSVQSESAHARLPLAGKLAVAFFLGWLGLTLYATFGARGAPAGKQAPLWACLNLRKSWQEFVGDHEDLAAQARHESQMRQRKVELNVLNPIKVVGCAFVVIGHSLILRTVVALDGLKAFHMIETDPIVLAMVIGTVVVDTFFVITGILLGYVVMRQANRKRDASREDETAALVGDGKQELANGLATKLEPPPPVEGERKTQKPQPVVRLFLTKWLKFAISRHLRLVPLYFLVFWYKKSIHINYFSPWPMWDAGFNKDTNYGACRHESWTTPFSFMAAFLPLSKQCLPQSWSVATDLFMSMTIPPIMLVMPRRPRLALAMGVVLSMLSLFWALSAYGNVDPHMVHEMNDMRAHGFALMFGSTHHLYTYPHFRFCSILIGMMAGYYLYFFGEQPDKLKEWPSWFRGPATKWAFGTIIMIVYGFSYTPALKYYIAPYHKFIFTNTFTSGRIVWSLCNAVIFMRMASDWRRNFLMRSYASRFWQSFVRLNFAILLIHLDVLFYFMSSATQLDYFGKQNVLTGFASAYFYCIPIAIILHVVYENPIDKLIRRFVVPNLFAT